MRDRIVFAGIFVVYIALAVACCMSIANSKDPHEAAQDAAIGFAIGAGAGRR